MKQRSELKFGCSKLRVSDSSRRPYTQAVIDVDWYSNEIYPIGNSVPPPFLQKGLLKPLPRSWCEICCGGRSHYFHSQNVMQNLQVLSYIDLWRILMHHGIRDELHYAIRLPSILDLGFGPKTRQRKLMLVTSRICDEPLATFIRQHLDSVEESRGSDCTKGQVT